MRKWITRILALIVVAEMVYLVFVNLALNLPLTQSLINELGADRFHVGWRRAWSLYPLNLQVRDISAGGRTETLQWGVDASSASASLSVLALFSGTVRVDNPTVTDLEYEQQLLAEEDGNADAAEPAADVSDASVVVAPEQHPGWKILVDRARVTGRHAVSLDDFKAAIDGEVGVDVGFDTGSSVLWLRNGAVDLALDSVNLGQQTDIAERAVVKGTLEMAPFATTAVDGQDIPTFLSVNVRIDAQVDHLGFLNFYLSRFGGMRIDGAGKLDSHLRYEKGLLLPQSHMVVSARELAVDLLAHRVAGDGDINMEVVAEDPETLRLGIEFGTLSARHSAEPAALFNGEGLAITTRGPARLFPFDRQDPESRYLAVKIPRVSFPDLNTYQRYFPDEWGVRLLGGTGELQGDAELAGSHLSGQLTLASPDANLAFRDYRFVTNLETGLFIDSQVLGDPTVDISGTYLRLDDARLASASAEEAPPWGAALTIETGTLGVRMPDGMGIGEDENRPYQPAQPVELKALLGASDAELRVNGTMSSLQWINLLFPNPYNLSIAGTGEVSANARLVSGKLAEGTRVEVLPEQLTVNFLDYAVKGDGLVSLELEKGGKRPDLQARIEVDDALLARQGGDKAFIENVAVRLNARGRQLNFDGQPENVELDLKIPSATIPDMSVYNQYFPEESPLKIRSGIANVTADVRLTPDSTGGFVRLITDDLRSRLNQQEISGQLTADINLAGGVPKDMDFDISGSSLSLDKVRVIGEQKTYEETDWSARFDLRKGRAVWRKPVELDIDAEIRMKDSRPLVAIFSNERGKHGWLSEIITIEDVRADAQLQLADEQLVIPHAFADSDKIGVGIKGLATPQHREGMFYVRFRALHGLLKVNDRDRNFDIIGARSQFDEYVPGELAFESRGAAAVPARPAESLMDDMSQ